MVVDEMEGVVKLVPVATDEPPDGTLNQFIVPALATAFNVTLPASQRLFGVVDVIVGVVFTVAITAVLDEEQLPSVA